MKKILTIVVVIVVVVIIGFVVVKPRFQGTNTSDQKNLVDNKMKIATGQIVLMIYQRGYGIKGVTAFENNPSYMALVTNLLEQLKKTYRIDATSSIKSSDHNFVVRLMVNGAQEFYCGDATNKESSVIVVPTNDGNFISATDCLGNPLK
jgi:hypothetical protein